MNKTIPAQYIQFNLLSRFPLFCNPKSAERLLGSQILKFIVHGPQWNIRDLSKLYLTS